MSTRDYRPGRVKVSGKMKEELYQLLIREEDTLRKKKNPAKWYRAAVADILKLDDKDNPSIRSYEKEIQDIRKGFRKNDPLDAPWSLASLVKSEYNIPPEALPIVRDIFYRRVQEEEKERLPEDEERLAPHFTIREALWIARLYTIFPVQEELMAKAKGLALRERVCTVLLDIPFTTRDLDTRLTEPDYRKTIEDSQTGRLQSIQPKPTIRDRIEKAKRNPSIWPAGVKTKTHWDAVIQELVDKGEVSEDVLYDSDAIIRWFKSLDPTKQKEIRRRAEELSPGAFAESPEEKARLEALSEVKRKQIPKKRKQEKGGTT